MASGMNVADAMNVKWQGAEAHYSTPVRGAFSNKALVKAFSLLEPQLQSAKPDISNSLSDQFSGSPGDNLDIWA